MAKGLGKGLNSLFEENETDFEESQKELIQIPITQVEPNKAQPRKTFEKDALDELASSIAQNGMLQPIIARPLQNGQYQIVSGERRWRAARLAGLREVPVIVKELDDKTTLEIGLIENLQREDLNIVEEAKGYRVLIEEFSLTQEEVAKRVGKSRPVIANAMRILALPEKVLDLVLEGQLSSGHARALLPLQELYEPQAFIKLVEQIVQKGLTVRDVENMAKKKPGKKQKAEDKNAIYYASLCENLSKSWGRKFRIKSEKSAKGKEKGTILIEYYSKDDFENLIEKLKDEGNANDHD